MKELIAMFSAKLRQDARTTIARTDLADEVKLGLVLALIEEQSFELENALMEARDLETDVLVEQALDAFCRFDHLRERARLCLNPRLQGLLVSSAADELAHDLKPRLHLLATRLIK